MSFLAAGDSPTRAAGKGRGRNCRAPPPLLGRAMPPRSPAMTNRPRPLVAGNWKMNGLRRSLSVLGEIGQGYTPGLKRKADLLVCPPATLVVAAAHALLGSGVAVGGQDCHAKEAGAFTGDVSAEMLADA